MTINERFEVIIKILFGGNKRAFALGVGISPTVVENVVGARKGKPSFDVLEKVCANANISAEWLLLGNGDMVSDMLEIRKDLVLYSDPKKYEAEGRTYVEDTNEDTTPSGEIIDKLVSQITQQAEEIGRLKERIAQLEREQQKNASGAAGGSIANAG